MAAKKAATKSKSRTSSKKTKSSLKWWYILPVIAIVAVAGYAIVRFGEAATVITTIRPNMWQGGGKVERKYTGGPEVKYVDNKIEYRIGGNTIQKGRKLCMDAFLVNTNNTPGRVFWNVRTYTPLFSGYRTPGWDAYTWHIEGATQTVNNTNGGRQRITLCTKNPIREGVASSGVKVEVGKVSGIVAVENVKLFQR